MASPAPMNKRMTTGPVRLGDLQIEAGTALFMVWAAGNHDPVTFPEPARFDPVRDGARPLIFGMGQHACLGHAIVRATLQERPAVFITKDARFTGAAGARSIPMPANMPAIRITW